MGLLHGDRGVGHVSQLSFCVLVGKLTMIIIQKRRKSASSKTGSQPEKWKTAWFREKGVGRKKETWNNMGWCCYERKVMSEMPQRVRRKKITGLAFGPRDVTGARAGAPLWGAGGDGAVHVPSGDFAWGRMYRGRSGKDAGGFLQLPG